MGDNLLMHNIIIKTKKIDGFTIVTGFDKRRIDPELTRIENFDKINNADESKKLRSKQKEKYEYFVKKTKSKKNTLSVLRLKEDACKKKDIEGIKKYKIEYDKHDIEYKKNLILEKQCNNELIKYKNDICKKAKKILRENPVFFELKNNEFLKSEQETSILIDAYNSKHKNQQLLINGKYIDDFLGYRYYYHNGFKWIIYNVITELGITIYDITLGDKYQDKSTEYIEHNDLTPDQIEEIRLQEMNDEQKKKEYDFKRDELLNRSILLRSKLEIQGYSSDDALVESKNFYNNKLDILQKIYK